MRDLVQSTNCRSGHAAGPCKVLWQRSEAVKHMHNGAAGKQHGSASSTWPGECPGTRWKANMPLGSTQAGCRPSVSASATSPEVPYSTHQVNTQGAKLYRHPWKP